MEDIDCACDLSKVGGLNALLAVLRSPHAALRAAAAEVLATAAQNNPKAQQQLLDGGVMERLLPLAREDADDTARLKGLLALGCASQLAASSMAHVLRLFMLSTLRRLDTQFSPGRGGVQAGGRLRPTQGASQGAARRMSYRITIAHAAAMFHRSRRRAPASCACSARRCSWRARCSPPTQTSPHVRPASAPLFFSSIALLPAHLTRAAALRARSRRAGLHPRGGGCAAVARWLAARGGACTAACHRAVRRL